jgi:hypothetical protein
LAHYTVGRHGKTSLNGIERVNLLCKGYQKASESLESNNNAAQKVIRVQHHTLWNMRIHKQNNTLCSVSKYINL